MLLHLDAPLIGYDGQAIRTSPATDAGPAKLRDVLGQTVITTSDADAKLTLDKKLERFRLAQAIVGAGETLDLAAEQISLLKKLVSDAWPINVVGAVVALIDPVG